jgi:hypothetical protein
MKDIDVYFKIHYSSISCIVTASKNNTMQNERLDPNSTFLLMIEKICSDFNILRKYWLGIQGISLMQF